MRVQTSIFALLAVLGCAEPPAPPVDLAVEVVRPGLAGAGTFEAVAAFGDNPGTLDMYRYVPSPRPNGPAPLVVAMHACSQSAAAYRNAGWEPLADEFGFYVLYPQQRAANNALNCFNWAGEFGNGANIPRDDGENRSIINMVNQMKADFAIDDGRVFTTGHSGGGAQSALMLATWPDVFAAGATIAGIPYLCTTNFNQVTACLNPGVPRDAQVWGDYVRNAGHNHPGPWPRVSVWQGTADGTVNRTNATEMIKQWTNVHGTDQEADETQMVDGHSRRLFHNARGEVVVEYYEIQGGGHGTFVDPDRGCGSNGAYFLDNNICSSLRIAEFFGITGGGPGPGDQAAPTVELTAPMDGATVSGQVQLTADADDDVGVVEVEFAVNGDPIGSAARAPWQVRWDARAVPAGRYTLRATARDAAGNTGVAEITVMLDSDVVDETPPTVNLTSPADASEVSGFVQLSAEASDDTAVGRVEFRANGEVVGEALAPPYEVAWNTTVLAPGVYDLAAHAFDAAGNEASDADTRVTVVAGPDPDQPPTVRLVSPADGATVNGVPEIKIEAVSASGVVGQVVLFWRVPNAGEQAIGTDRAAPFSFLWDVRVAEEGPHTLVARAFDAAGGVGSLEFTLVVDHSAVTPEPDAGVPAGDAGAGGGGSEEDPKRAGRSYWGCSAAPSGSGNSLILLGILGLVVARRKRLALGLLALLGGCEGDPVYVYVGGDGGGAGGEPADPDMGQTTLDLSSPARIEGFLEGKVLVMNGDDIPSHPNGFNQDVNFGQATQCYHEVAITVLGGTWTTRSVLGTLTGASDVGALGMCDTSQPGAPLEFPSTAILINNVEGNGTCFDVTATYAGFGQEGRGRIAPDGSTVELEFFFKDQAVGHRCADGDVGQAGTVTLSEMPFTGDAVQTYRVMQP